MPNLILYFSSEIPGFPTTKRVSFEELGIEPGATSRDVRLAVQRYMSDAGDGDFKLIDMEMER